jgi:hypothetical protein
MYARLVLGALVVGAFARASSAVTISFNDQAPPDTGTVESSQMSLDGIHPSNTYYVGGVTVTFTGFGRNEEAYYGLDASNSDPPGMIWGTTDTPTIQFSSPVSVKSFWVVNYTSNFDGHMFTVKGTGPTQSFPGVYVADSIDPNEDGLFWEVTGNESFAFADYAITKLEFTNFTEVLFDDLTFEPVAVPEPASAALVSGLIGVLALARPASTRRRARQSCPP